MTQIVNTAAFCSFTLKKLSFGKLKAALCYFVVTSISEYFLRMVGVVKAPHLLTNHERRAWFFFVLRSVVKSHSNTFAFTASGDTETKEVEDASE